ncbi:hypothetical protein SAMN05444166_2619 [Singulisphaera sp. GP187]|nr:hypothetical protein SAMN05444166_2619 [Singulisphaera sp. GP187]
MNVGGNDEGLGASGTVATLSGLLPRSINPASLSQCQKNQPMRRPKDRELIALSVFRRTKSPQSRGDNLD